MTETRARWATVIMLAAGIGMLMFGFCGCTIPSVVPEPPGPAPTGDQRFAGFHDCTSDPTGFAQAARELAHACGDREDTAACFVALSDQGGSATQLLCAARDVQVAGYIEINRGTAGPELTARARRLKSWLDTTGATLRGAP